MQAISYARHQFPAEIIRHAVWLYLRFTLSYRDVEELLAERGIETSYETVRRWVLKIRPLFARNLRRLRPRPTSTWHLRAPGTWLRWGTPPCGGALPGGGPSIARARSWICWSTPSGTSGRP